MGLLLPKLAIQGLLLFFLNMLVCTNVAILRLMAVRVRESSEKTRESSKF